MPWNEQTIMSMRTELVCRFLENGESMTVLARAYGVSRKTGYKWVRRATGEGTVADHSRRPRVSPARTSSEREAQVLAVKATCPTWGARKIHHALRQQGLDAVPAASTIHAILRRHGYRPPPAPPAAWTRFEANAPNDLWQMDFKGWHPLRQGRVHPLTLLDDHSRFLLRIQCLGTQTRAAVQPILTEVFRCYGLPRAILCDHGPPWGMSVRPALTGLEVWLMQLDIRVLHGRPYHPQTQGKLERLHRTLKADVFANRTFRDLDDAQQACDRFRDQYNLVRPHEALGQVPPLRRYRQSLRPFPDHLPDPCYADDVTVRRVSSRGAVQVAGRKLAVSEGLAGHLVGLRPTARDGDLEVLFYSHVIRIISLHDPEHAP